MQIRMAWAWALCSVLSVGPVSAQDDAPWWRQLFGQGKDTEQPVVVPEPVGSPASMESPTALPAEDHLEETPESELLDAEGAMFTARESMGMGSVAWNIPVSIQELDTLKQAEEDIRIPGFRVQLFMGKLDSARALRQHLTEELALGLEIHLTPYPPIFGVQVGDFRTALAAHRVMHGLKRMFPNALVVPAALDPTLAFPVAEGCIWAP